MVIIRPAWKYEYARRGIEIRRSSETILGFMFMILFSGCSYAKDIAGSNSVNRSIHKRRMAVVGKGQANKIYTRAPATSGRVCVNV